MLTEPVLDEFGLGLDSALLEAITAAIAHRLASPTPFSPDAEAIMLRTLLDRAPDYRQKTVLKAVFGRMAALQGPDLLACGPEASVLAADRFGTLRPVENPDTALTDVSRGARATIDIVSSRPWWGRLLARPDIRVIGALRDDRNSLPRALTVSTETSGPTGDDRSFWVTDSTLGDARLGQILADIGLAGHPLVSKGGLKLFMLAGYVQSDDGRLIEAPGSLKGVIGAAPVF